MSNEKAFNKLSEKYYSAYGKNPEYQYFLEELLGVVRKGLILDLGCGNGLPVARYLINRGYDVKAVDFSKKMIAQAKINIPEADIIYSDLRSLKLEENSVDGATAFFTFNYLRKKELEKVFGKVSNSIKEDGGIIISAIEGSFEGETSLLGEKVYMRQFSEDDLRILLAGFHILLVERREYEVPGESLQSQIFIIGKKKTVVESMLQEQASSQGSAGSKGTESSTADEGKLNKMLDAALNSSPSNAIQKADSKGKKKIANKKQLEDEEEGHAIRITFFKKKKSKKI